MEIANAVLLLVTALVMFVVAFAVADDRGDGLLGLFISVIPVTSLVLGLLQLTLPSRGMHIAVGCWLSLLAAIAAFCALVARNDRQADFAYLFTFCFVAMGGMGVLQFIYVV